MLLIVAILAEVSKTKLTSSIIDETVAIRHSTLFVIFESGCLEASLDTFSEL